MRKRTLLLKKGVALLVSVAMAVTLVPFMGTPITVKAVIDKTIAGLETSVMANPTPKDGTVVITSWG